MRLLPKFLFLASWLVAVGSLAAQQSAQPQRQPAPVMGVAGAEWLVRPERIQEEEPDRMLAALEIRRGDVVADVGAGVGYHTWRLSEIVGPSGKVIAEDIQPGMIERLRQNVESRKLRNVEIVQGTPTDPRLPANAVDLVLMVDVYHEFSEPAAMMRHIRNALKPGGRLVLVEFRKEDPRVPIQPLHKMSIEEARAELEGMGFRFQKSMDFLPWQHILIFTPAG
jgi:ubiquinone/menaquinone biosynthesis C-methylase UbiE